MAVTSRSAINKLGDRIRDHGLSQDDRELLLDYRASFLPAYESVVARIRATLPELQVTGRPEKTPDSIVAKLRRTGIELARMQDIAGCRLIVDQLDDQDRTVARLVSVSDKAKVVDRRKEPSFGYRAVHVIPTVDGRQVEIQVRTFPQHLWASTSERLADEFGTDLKYGGDRLQLLPAKRYLERASVMIAAFETSDNAQFLEDPVINRESAVMGAALAIMTIASFEEL